MKETDEFCKRVMSIEKIIFTLKSKIIEFEKIDGIKLSILWSKITEEHSVAPILDIGTFNYHEFMARCMMTVISATLQRQ